MAYKKGLKFQEEFGEFLKKDLNWDKVSIETPVPGAINKKGTSVDIIAERLDERGERFRKLGNIYLVICGLLLAFGLLWGFIDNWDDGISMGCIIMGIILELGGVVALHLGNKYNKENAWVECKNLKTKVDKDKIRKMIDEYKDYVKTGDKKYKVKHLYFASANGYIKNAIEYADHHGVKCYVKTGRKKFEQVEFWD